MSKHFSIFFKIVENVFTWVFRRPADCPLPVWLLRFSSSLNSCHYVCL